MDKKSIRDHLEQKSDELKKGAKGGDPFIWHRIIMGCILALVGVFLIGAILLNFVLERQAYEIRHIPVVDATENAVLPEGDYNIYSIYFDEDKVNHYIVSLKDGGVVVAVKAPESTQVPRDILRMVKYDPATYTLHVTSNGSWHFVSTSVRDAILKQIESQTPQADTSETTDTANQN
ncbi:hypothetical protein [Mitsuokella multacida]|uniref:hypothetical protein n=1 Tax=Mitsuokella multacida TaxID=52226 RepID=UPI0026DC4CE2|nr:hypothetical protein [Mitsuokella multacida]